MSTEKEKTFVPAPLPLAPLKKEHVAMLWQLVNAQGVGAPLPQAHIGAELFAIVRDAAAGYGLIQS